MRLAEVRLQRIERELQLRRQARLAAQPDRRFSGDPALFARRLGFEPDPWQERVLQWQGKRLLMNVTRQGGKSSVAAILDLHRALYFPRSLILLVSPSLRQSSELFRKCQDFLSLLPVRPVLLEDNRLSLQLANGSRIVSLPAKEANVRGFSGASLIIEDESARMPDDLFLACRPMLAVSNGRHILMSTPWGRRGHFHALWEGAGPDWERVCVPADQCPRISPEFLAEERRVMPKTWYDSEYNCLFTDTVDQFFSSDSISGAIDPTVAPLFPDLEHRLWTSEPSSSAWISVKPQISPPW